MRRDRDGELLDLEGSPTPVQHDCQDGWLGEDWLGRPRPCLVCKPWLRADRRKRAEP